MADREPTEEEIYGDDKDPVEAIYAIRQSQADAAGEEGDENLENIKDSLAENGLQTEIEAEDEITLGKKPEDEIEEDPSKKEETQEDPDKKPEDPEKKPEDGEIVEGEEDETGKAADDSGEEKPGVRKYTADGKEYEFTEQEILEKFGTIFGQAMNYTQKMQKIAPYRRMISAMEEEGITEEQFNVAVDAMKGNKEAIQQLMKTHNIDPLDIDPEAESTSYQPTQYGKTDFQQRIEEVTSKISSDPEYSTTVDVIQNRWDPASKSAFAKNPEMIAGLHNDIKTGLYDKVVPIAAKLKVLDGNSKSDIEYYMLAGEQVSAQESSQSTVEDTNKRTQAEVDKSGQASSEAQRKRAAASTKTRADKKGVIDYLEDDDEDFDKWYQGLMSKN